MSSAGGQDRPLAARNLDILEQRVLGAVRGAVTDAMKDSLPPRGLPHIDMDFVASDGPGTKPEAQPTAEMPSESQNSVPVDAAPPPLTWTVQPAATPRAVGPVIIVSTLAGIGVAIAGVFIALQFNLFTYPAKFPTVNASDGRLPDQARVSGPGKTILANISPTIKPPRPQPVKRPFSAQLASRIKAPAASLVVTGVSSAVPSVASMMAQPGRPTEPVIQAGIMSGALGMSQPGQATGIFLAGLQDQLSDPALDKPLSKSLQRSLTADAGTAVTVPLTVATGGHFASAQAISKLSDEPAHGDTLASLLASDETARREQETRKERDEQEAIQDRLSELQTARMKALVLAQQLARQKEEDRKLAIAAADSEAEELASREVDQLAGIREDYSGPGRQPVDQAAGRTERFTSEVPLPESLVDALLATRKTYLGNDRNASLLLRTETKRRQYQSGLESRPPKNNELPAQTAPDDQSRALLEQRLWSASEAAKKLSPVQSLPAPIGQKIRLREKGGTSEITGQLKDYDTKTYVLALPDLRTVELQADRYECVSINCAKTGN